MQMPPLIEARLIRRHRRFLADVELADGTRITAHCPNTGALLGCDAPGSRVWLSVADSPRRKYRHTWELVEVSGGVLVCVHTGRSNALVHEGIAAGVIAELGGYEEIRGEVRFGDEGSRVDLFLTRDNGWSRCFVEVKNVTAAVEKGVALFPDAPSERAARHLRELMSVVRAGDRGVIVFCVQRADARELRPADAIDPAYGRQLRQALAAGVEALAYRAEVSPGEIRLSERLPVVCPAAGA
jgi:sugar fermentation stimulation protein A